MPLSIPSRLEDLSNEDILDIAWEAEFLDHATPLESLLLQRLGEQCQSLACAREDCRRLLDGPWYLG
jgi:hypothetical protein